jgi:hypothetical protein
MALQIVVNFGDSYGSGDVKPFYNETWFASLCSASVALIVVGINYLLQRCAKLSEKRKQLADLREYFFAMTSGLTESLGEQIAQFENLSEQIRENPYGGYKLSIISSLNLDKIYYLSPTQSFEIFVTSQTGDSKEKSEGLIKIYKAFDNIQTVKEMDQESRQIFTKNNIAECANYWETIYKVKQYKRSTKYEIVKTNTIELDKLGEGISQIVNDFEKIKDPTIAVAHEELMVKLANFLNSDLKFIASPYWQTKCEGHSQYLAVSIHSYLQALRKDKLLIEEETSKLHLIKKN